MRNLPIFLALVGLVACEHVEPSQEGRHFAGASVAEACAQFGDDTRTARILAFQGDVAAIDCMIAEADASDLRTQEERVREYEEGRAALTSNGDEISKFMADLVYPAPSQFNPINSVAWRYIRWIKAGEQPDGIMDLAAETYPIHLRAIINTYLMYIENVRYNRQDDEGCFLMPPRMRVLLQASEAASQTDFCIGETVPHPTH